MEKLHFVSGLPRSGSTLLCNILMQNPRFHASATSGLLEVLFLVRNQWDKLLEHQGQPEEQNEQRKKAVMQATIQAYYVDVDKPVIFDKSRGWLAYLEMAEYLIEGKAKVLVPVRDMRDVLASFEKIWRAESRHRQLDQESALYFQWQTVAGRCEAWCQGDQPVGLAYNRIKDALSRGYGERMHFVPYEQLTGRPKPTMQGIYAFLEEEYFEHDFDHVEQVTWEDDRVHGMKLHDIRLVVEPQLAQWPLILGDIAQKYAGLELW